MRWFKAITLDKPELLRNVLPLLAGNAYISIEGDLSRFDLEPHVRPIAEKETSLRRQTDADSDAFIVFSLTLENYAEVWLRLFGPAHPRPTGLVRIQIEKDGQLAFAVADGFRPGIAMVSEKIPPNILTQLQDKKVVSALVEISGY